MFGYYTQAGRLWTTARKPTSLWKNWQAWNEGKLLPSRTKQGNVSQKNKILKEEHTVLNCMYTKHFSKENNGWHTCRPWRNNQYRRQDNYKLRFADDIDGLAGQELVKLVNHLEEASIVYGMQISAEKTQLMTNNTNGISTDHRQKEIGDGM